MTDLRITGGAISLLLVAGMAVAADGSQTSSASGPAALPVEPYTGQDLDIKRVIRIRHNAGSSSLNPERPCRTEPTEMIYEDSKGKVHDVEYEERGGDCSSNN